MSRADEGARRGARRRHGVDRFALRLLQSGASPELGTTVLLQAIAVVASVRFITGDHVGGRDLRFVRAARKARIFAGSATKVVARVGAASGYLPRALPGHGPGDHIARTSSADRSQACTRYAIGPSSRGLPLIPDNLHSTKLVP